MQVLQKRCLKHACRLKQRHSTVDLFNSHCKGVLNIESLYKLNVCSFVHKAVNGKSHNSVTFEKTVHRYDTRSRKPLSVKLAKSKLGSKSITVVGGILFNSLPERIASLGDYRFRVELKEWLSELQYPG